MKDCHQKQQTQGNGCKNQTVKASFDIDSNPMAEGYGIFAIFRQNNDASDAGTDTNISTLQVIGEKITVNQEKDYAMTEVSETDVTTPQSGDLIPIIRNVDGLSALMHYDGEDIANAGNPSFVSSLLSTETVVPVARPKSGCLRFVALGSALPTVGTDEQVTLAILDGNSVLYADQGTGLTNMGVQGQSSANATKHNWKFKIKNAAGSKVSLRLGDWPESTSTDLKAYGTIAAGDVGAATAMDRSMIREAISLDMWRQIRRAHDYPGNLIAPETAYEDATTTVFGNPLFSCDVIPVELYWTTDVDTAPTFLGQYMWRSDNSNDTYLMDDSNALHYLLQPQHGPTNLWSQSSDSAISTYWEYSSPSTPNNAVVRRLFDWLASCVSTDANWEQYADYIDLNSWIDYVVFCWAVGSPDSVVNNVMLGSHNATTISGIWSLYSYDLDETFGVYWNTQGKSATQLGANFPTYTADSVFTSFWSHFSAQIGARWKILRSNGILTENNLHNIIRRYLGSMRPAAIVADQTAWGTNTISTVPYITDWFSERLIYGDTVFASTGATAVTLLTASASVVVGNSVELSVGTDRAPGTDVHITLASSIAGTFSENPVTIPAGSNNSQTVSFTASTTGTTSISVSNDSNLSNPTPVSVSAVEAATKPGTPTLAANAGDSKITGTVTVTDDGGASVSEIEVFMGTAAGGESTTAATTTAADGSFSISLGVTNGTEYFLTATATNSIGTSAASNEVSVTPTADVMPSHYLLMDGNGGGASFNGPNGPFNTTNVQEYELTIGGTTLSITKNTALLGQTVNNTGGLMLGTGRTLGVGAVNSSGSNEQFWQATSSANLLTDTDLTANPAGLKIHVVHNASTSASTDKYGASVPAATVRLNKSLDGGQTWTHMEDLTATANGLSATNKNWWAIGSATQNSSGQFAGNIYSGEVRDGTGKVLINPDFTTLATGTTSFKDSADNTYTVWSTAKVI